MDEQLPPAIRLNTVGVIQEGKYAGWYIVVNPKDSPMGRSYTTYICTDTTFVFDPDVRGCYDDWSQDIASLEHLFDRDYGNVEWREDIAPPQFGPYPESERIAARLRGRMVEKARAAQAAKEAGDEADDGAGEDSGQSSTP